MNDAEILLTVARMIKCPKERLVIPCNSWKDKDTERMRTALEFDKRPNVFKMRAMVEDWDMIRIVREMY